MDMDVIHITEQSKVSYSAVPKLPVFAACHLAQFSVTGPVYKERAIITESIEQVQRYHTHSHRKAHDRASKALR